MRREAAIMLTDWWQADAARAVMDDTRSILRESVAAAEAMYRAAAAQQQAQPGEGPRPSREAYAGTGAGAGRPPHAAVSDHGEVQPRLPVHLHLAQALLRDFNRILGSPDLSVGGIEVLQHRIVPAGAEVHLLAEHVEVGIGPADLWLVFERLPGARECGRRWKALRANDVLVSEGWEDAYYARSTWGGKGGNRPIVVSYATSPAAVPSSEKAPDVPGRTRANVVTR